jgi:molecular chaperone DnaK (HSP70)
MQGPSPEIQETRESKPLAPSAVGISQSGEILVGELAIDNWQMAPRDTIVSIKRLMGRGYDDPEVQRVKSNFQYEIVEPADGTRDSVRVVMGGRQYSPVDISAMILAKLKADASDRLGEEVTEAVITVPAYFSQAQKSATRAAGLKAGLKVLRVLEEPTAAAYAYNLDDTGSEPKIILVYDLGGGTFDISVLMMSPGGFAPLDKEGDMWLGGDDMDQVVIDFALPQIRKQYGGDPTTDRRFMVALRQKAQRAKERLSGITGSVDIILAGLLKGPDGHPLDFTIPISRAQFEDLIKPLVDRTMTLVDLALKNANVSDDEIAYVLMAGNATMTPLVQKTVEARFGRERVKRKSNPKKCVAEGAAIVAKLQGDVVVCSCGHENAQGATSCEECGSALEVAAARLCPNCGVGNEAAAAKCTACGTALEEGGAAGRRVISTSTFDYGIPSDGDRLSIFIHKNDTLPTPVVWKPFSTLLAGQRMLCLPVYGGDEGQGPSASTKQGQAFSILPAGLPKGAVIRIGLALDSNEIFELRATLEDGTDLRPWVIEGNLDARVIGLLEEVERQAGTVVDGMSEADHQQLDGYRDRAFGLLRKSSFPEAQDVVEEMKKSIGGIKPTPGNKYLGLIGWTRHLLDEYSWSLEPVKCQQLIELIGRLEAAMATHEETNMEQAFTALDMATNEMGLASLLMGMDGAIRSKVQPYDPARGEALLTELARVAQAIKREPEAGLAMLPVLSDKILKAIKECEPQGQVCPVPGCGAPVVQGERYCPKGHDTWGVRGSGPAITTSS